MSESTEEKRGPGRPRSVATGPSDADVTAAENAALKAEIARLQSQLAAAPVAPVAPEPRAPEPAKLGSDPYGPLSLPRRMHGILCRDPVVLSGKHGAKTYNPGSTYTKGPNGTPLTVDEARTIMHALSEDCWRLKMKDTDDGNLNVFLGEVHENG